MDDMTGDDAGGVWMTYGEMAQARGIKRSTAIRLAQRHRWRKQAGNDGLARVLVPQAMAKPGDRHRDVRAVAARDDTPDTAPDLPALFEAALAALREQQAHERAQHEAARASDRDRHEHARASWEAERTRLAEQCAQVAVLELKIARLEREAAEERELSRWQRIRRAWRRGRRDTPIAPGQA